MENKIFKTASDPKCDGYQRGLPSIVHNFFDKKSARHNKSSGSGIANEPNYQLAIELHKPIIQKFEKFLFIFYRQYLGSRFNRYGLTEQI